MSNEPSRQPLVAALKRQVDGYRALAKLAEAQRRHVQSGQTEPLLDVLKRRQGVLDQILDAEQTVGPAKKNWSELAAAMPPGERTEAEGLMAETRRLLEQVVTSDRDDVVLLQQRKLNVGRQINRTAAAKAVNRTYAAAAYGTRRSSVDLSQ